jgi:hypothetical protein
MSAFYRTVEGDIVDLDKMLLLQKWETSYRIFLPNDIYMDITYEDYVRINNYLARWNNSTYFKILD